MVDKKTYSAGPTLPEIFEEVSDDIAYMTRDTSPLLFSLGFPNNVGNVGNPRFSWLEEALNPDAAVINNGGPHAPGDTALNVVAGQGSRFSVGDTVQIDGLDELMLVQAPIAPNVVTVLRAQFGTTAVAIPDGSVMKRIHNAPVENEAAGAATSVLRTRPENYTQIFRQIAEVTRSMRLSNTIGVADELEHQIALAQRNLIRDLAKSVVSGRKQVANPEGTNTTPRTMDGIIALIKNGGDPVIIDANGQALDEFLLNLALREMFTRGASPSILAAPPAQRRAISALIEGRQRYVDNSDTLGAVVQQFISDFATLNILEADIFIPSDTILILDPSRARIVKLGDEPNLWDVDPLGKPGLTDKAEVVGEFSIELKNAGDGGHAIIENLAV